MRSVVAASRTLWHPVMFLTYQLQITRRETFPRLTWNVFAWQKKTYMNVRSKEWEWWWWWWSCHIESCFVDRSSRTARWSSPSNFWNITVDQAHRWWILIAHGEIRPTPRRYHMLDSQNKGPLKSQPFIIQSKLSADDFWSPLFWEKSTWANIHSCRIR